MRTPRPVGSGVGVLARLLSAGICWAAGTTELAGAVTAGPELDYQSSILRVAPTGELLLVFERIEPGTFFGDLWVTSSTDEGQSWSSPQAIVDS